MFRIVRIYLDKVPYATIFGYNAVLQSVFSAPKHKEAIVVEIPGNLPQTFTYGRIQKDVLSLANIITRRKEVLMKAQGRPSLSWVQEPRPDDVLSIFSNEGIEKFSCDVMKDDGAHNSAIMGSVGYPFVVALLASWSLNQMAVPLSVSQTYEGELSYILEHSRSRQVLGDAATLRAKFPPAYDARVVRDLSEVADTAAAEAPSAATYDVESLYDVDSLVEQAHARAEAEENMVLLSPEHLPAEDERAPMHTAQDIMDRLEREKNAEADRMEEIQFEKMWAHYKACSAVPEADEGSGLFYDTDHLESLNEVHRRWVEECASRPSKHDDCVMIYTSGTTAKPKGAVHTHASVRNMVNVLQTAWEWSEDDKILHVLPMHHIHGLVNVLLCSLASKACCVLTKFDDPIRIAHRLERGDITLFMAVPTVYTKLISSVHTNMSPIEKTGFKNAVSQALRLMVSGSSALPVPTLQQFHEISGHTLLERYGMTEVGMALSQPLRPIKNRIPGTVGSPLPTTRAFVYSSSDDGPNDEKNGFDTVGRLAIASGSLFDRYWANPEATRKELVTCADGQRYFDTGDTVGVRGQPNADSAVFTILGRTSVDIIKSRGYKLSALEIEAALLTRKDLFLEVAVLGSRDEEQGEKVVAIVAPQPATREKWKLPSTFTCVETPELNEELKRVARDLVAYYKCPERFLIVPEIPRNPTGKVNKKNLKKTMNLA